MTMPTIQNSQDSQDLNPIRIMLLATDHINGSPEGLTWVVGGVHPLDESMKVIGMYVNGGIVEIYSFDGKQRTIREIIPFHRTRLTREEMPVDVFKEELAIAEQSPTVSEQYRDDDDDDYPEDPPTAVPVNGQTAS